MLDHEQSIRAADATNEVFISLWTPRETGTIVVIPEVALIASHPKLILAFHTFLSA